MSPLQRISSFLRPHRLLAALAIAMLVASVIAELSIPSLIQRIIDNGIVTRDMNLILNTTLLIIGTALLDAILGIGNTLLSVRVAQGFAADIRSAVFHKIQSFSFGNLDDFQTGQLMVRLTSDVSAIQTVVVMGLRIFIRAPIMIVGSIYLMLRANDELAAVTLILMPFTLLLTGFFVIKAQPMYLRLQRRLDRLNEVLQENMAGVRVVKAFVRMKHESERFGKANMELTEQSITVTRFLSVLIPTMSLIINLNLVGVIWFGGQQVIIGRFTIG